MNQLAAFQQLPRRMPGTGQIETIIILGVLNRTQRSKWIPTRTLCQKNQGTVKTKQKQIAVVTGLLMGHFHLKGHLFKMGLTNSTLLRKMPRKRWIRHTGPMWLWGYSLRFRHLHHCFTELGDHQDVPVSKILHFILSIGMLKSWNRGGCTRDQWK
jgi:hypothetical protein